MIHDAITLKCVTFTPAAGNPSSAKATGSSKTQTPGLLTLQEEMELKHQLQSHVLHQTSLK